MEKSKINQHGTPDVKPDAPIYRHSSSSARSPSDAGGPLPASEWSPRPIQGNDNAKR
jgi:hypothetical protein